MRRQVAVKKWPFMNHQNATHHVKSHQKKHQNVAEKYIKVCRKNAITVLLKFFSMWEQVVARVGKVRSTSVFCIWEGYNTHISRVLYVHLDGFKRGHQELLDYKLIVKLTFLENSFK